MKRNHPARKGGSIAELPAADVESTTSRRQSGFDAIGAFTGPDRATTTFLLAVSAVALGVAMQFFIARIHDAAFLGLTVSFVFCVAGVLAPRVSLFERFGESPILFVLGIGFIVQFSMQLGGKPGVYLTSSGPGGVTTFIVCCVSAAVLAAAGLSERSWLGRARVPLLLAIHFVLGCWLIQASPRPFIDVFVFQKLAVEGLLTGQNPYEIPLPNIYGNRPFFAPELVSGDRVLFGFCYMPLSLLLIVPGHLLGGDFRYSQLAAYTLSGALLAYARPGRLGAAAAALFLFTPRGLFILEQSWTEPFVALFFTGLIYACCRAPRFFPWVLGLLLAVKQYTFLALPALLLLPALRARELAWRAVRIAVLLAAAITLPWLLMNPERFMSGVVWFQFSQPFRADALGFPAWLFREHGIQLPVWVGFLAYGAAVALALWRAPRTPAGVAGAVAILFFAFFAFNKMAFANYYYFVLSAMCCAIAAARLDRAEPMAGARA